eukprot:scaffold133266_cov94-Phaeocystis_antarctica.AAC.2
MTGTPTTVGVGPQAKPGRQQEVVRPGGFGRRYDGRGLPADIRIHGGHDGVRHVGAGILAPTAPRVVLRAPVVGVAHCELLQLRPRREISERTRRGISWLPPR